MTTTTTYPKKTKTAETEKATTKVVDFETKSTATNAIAAIIGSLIGVGIEVLMIKKWDFSKHSKITNFLMTASRNTEEYKKYCIVANTLNAVTCGYYILQYIECRKRNHQ